MPFRAVPCGGVGSLAVGDSFEPARRIYEAGANKQTIGNQMVVRELFDGPADRARRQSADVGVPAWG